MVSTHFPRARALHAPGCDLRRINDVSPVVKHFCMHIRAFRRLRASDTAECRSFRFGPCRVDFTSSACCSTLITPTHCSDHRRIVERYKRSCRETNDFARLLASFSLEFSLMRLTAHSTQVFRKRRDSSADVEATSIQLE